MDNKLQQAEYNFIESISKLCDDFGLNKFVAQLYAVLYLSDKPISLDEMVEKLGVSKGNVSINIRELEKMGAVKEVWIRGSRKDYYEAELNIQKIIMNKLKSSIQKRLGEISRTLEEFNNIVHSNNGGLSKEEKNKAKVFQERLGKIEELKTLALKALGFAENFV